MKRQPITTDYLRAKSSLLTTSSTPGLPVPAMAINSSLQAALPANIPKPVEPYPCSKEDKSQVLFPRIPGLPSDQAEIRTDPNSNSGLISIIVFAQIDRTILHQLYEEQKKREFVSGSLLDPNSNICLSTNAAFSILAETPYIICSSTPNNKGNSSARTQPPPRISYNAEPPANDPKAQAFITQAKPKSWSSNYHGDYNFAVTILAIRTGPLDLLDVHHELYMGVQTSQNKSSSGSKVIRCFLTSMSLKYDTPIELGFFFAAYEAVTTSSINVKFVMACLRTFIKNAFPEVEEFDFNARINPYIEIVPITGPGPHFPSQFIIVAMNLEIANALDNFDVWSSLCANTVFNHGDANTKEHGVLVNSVPISIAYHNHRSSLKSHGLSYPSTYEVATVTLPETTADNSVLLHRASLLAELIQLACPTANYTFVQKMELTTPIAPYHKVFYTAIIAMSPSNTSIAIPSILEEIADELISRDDLSDAMILRLSSARERGANLENKGHDSKADRIDLAGRSKSSPSLGINSNFRKSCTIPPSIAFMHRSQEIIIEKGGVIDAEVLSALDIRFLAYVKICRADCWLRSHGDEFSHLDDIKDQIKNPSAPSPLKATMTQTEPKQVVVYVDTKQATIDNLIARLVALEDLVRQQGAQLRSISNMLNNEDSAAESTPLKRQNTSQNSDKTGRNLAAEFNLLRTRGIYNHINLSCLNNLQFNKHSPTRSVRHQHHQYGNKQGNIRQEVTIAKQRIKKSEVLSLKSNTLPRDPHIVTTTTFICRATPQLSLSQSLPTPTNSYCRLPNFRINFFLSLKPQIFYLCSRYLSLLPLSLIPPTSKQAPNETNFLCPKNNLPLRSTATKITLFHSQLLSSCQQSTKTKASGSMPGKLLRLYATGTDKEQTSTAKEQTPLPQTRSPFTHRSHTRNNYSYSPLHKHKRQSKLATASQYSSSEQITPAKYPRRKRRGDRRGRIRKITLPKNMKARFTKFDKTPTSPVNNTHNFPTHIPPSTKYTPPPSQEVAPSTANATRISPHQVEIRVKHWTSPRAQTLMTPPIVQSQALLLQILSRLNIPQQASNQIIMKINNKKIDSSYALPLQLRNEDTVDISLRLLGGGPKRKQPQTDSKEEDYSSDEDDHNDNISSDNKHTPTNPLTSESNNWSSPQKDQRHTANRVSVNIATINFNGSTSVMHIKDTTHLAKFIKDRDIHILSLTDHRSSMEQLQGITSQISRITQRDTKLAAASERISDNSNRHARVGGTAIILIGKLAHAHVTTSTLDESSTNFITSTVLQYEKDIAPPLIIHSIYMFPTNNRSGPVTANTRLHEHISSRYPLRPPSTTQWMNDLIHKQISQLEEKHPNAIQIIAGDLNHKKWSNPEDPKTKLFIDQLQFQNLPYDHEHQRSSLSSSSYQGTKTFIRHTKNKITGQTTDTSRWIDHILTKGNILHSSHYADHKHDIVQDLDHIPFVAKLTLPNAFANHTVNHKAYLKAQQLNNYQDVNVRLPHIIEKYQTHLQTLNSEIMENDTLEKIEAMVPINLEELLAHINKSLVQAAAKTNPATNLNRPIANLWSPTRELQRRTRLAISSSLSIMNQLEDPKNKEKKEASTRHALQRIRKKFTLLLKVLWEKKSTREKHHPFRNLLTDNPSYIDYKDLLDNSNAHNNKAPCRDILKLIQTFALVNKQTTPQDIINILYQEQKRLSKNSHTRNMKTMRKQISDFTKKEAKAVHSGQTKKAIQRLNPTKQNSTFKALVSENGNIITNIKTAYDEIRTNKENHFKLDNSYLSHTKLNEPTAENMIRINSILDGSYKEKHLESLLPNHLSEQQKRDLTSILDVCKKKTSTEQDNLIKTALSTEVTFEEWNNQLYAKKGRTTPGPTNVTYNMLKAAPPNINKALFLIYKRFYQLKIVPKEWQKRIMALIPKKAEVTINTLRPIMLLETGRKLWLGIIAARLDNTMTAMNLFHPAQTGCSHNRGTEDAIITVLNGLEDAHQRRENLHLISFDTSKAFDSPARYSGLYIAWRRLGLDHEHAQYIINCDIENEITPKTTFSILHPNQAEPFRAECGTPQGDSLAGYQWRAITDIAITFLSEHKSEWDAYTYRHQTTTHLREIEPVIFVDDMNALSKSTQGCVRLVQLQATLAQLLNFNLNPQKTWRMSIVWDEEKKLLIDQTHTSLEYINPHNNRAGQIRTVRNNEICRILGAYITADLNPNHLQQKLRLEMRQLVKYIEKKKMHAAVFNAVLHQSIYPKMAYQAKFSSLQHKEINAAFQPVKDLLEKINNIQLFPKEIIYGGSAETYVMPFKQLSDYVNSAKHGIINRLMDGHIHYKEAILAMIQRGIQQKKSWPSSPTSQWSTCFRAQDTLEEKTVSKTNDIEMMADIYDEHDNSRIVWATSWIEWIQEATLSVSIHQPLPQAPGITQTPIAKFYTNTESKHKITERDLQHFLLHHNIQYVEELFNYYPEGFPTEEQKQKDFKDFQEWLTHIVNHHYHTFLIRVWNQAAQDPSITRGLILARTKLITMDPITEKISEALNYVCRDTSHELEVATREHTYFKGCYNSSSAKREKKRSRKQMSCHAMRTKKNNHHPAHWSHNTQPGNSLYNIHPLTPRLLHGPHTCKNWKISERPFLLLHQKIVPLEMQHIQGPPNHNIIPSLPLPTQLSDEWEKALRRLAYREESKSIYTDASMESVGWVPQLDYSIFNNTINIAIVFGDEMYNEDPWSQRNVTALRISGHAADMSAYDAELLGAGIAACLISSKADHLQSHQKAKIITDCKGIVTKINKIKQNIVYTSQEDDSPNPYSHREDIAIHREGLKNNLLIKTILAQSSTTSISHQPAHAERSKDVSKFNRNEMGNYIADYIAGHREDKIRDLVGSLQIIEIPLQDIKNQLSTFSPVKIHQLYEDEKIGPSFEGSASKIQEHICKNRLHKYFLTRSETFYGHHKEWLNICFEVAGKAFKTITPAALAMIQQTFQISTRHFQRTFFRITNDKWANDYSKAKFADKRLTEAEQAEHVQNTRSTIEINRSIASINQKRKEAEETGDEDTRDEADKAEQSLREECGDWFEILPPCPCCKSILPPGTLLPKDSMSHLIYECQHPSINEARTLTLRNLEASASQISPERLRLKFINLVSTLHDQNDQDSRRWAGAFSTTILSNLFEDTPLREVLPLLARIQKAAIPAVAYMWKVYCNVSHNSQQPIPTIQGTAPKQNKQTILSFRQNQLRTILPKYNMVGQPKRRLQKTSKAACPPSQQKQLASFFPSQTPVNATSSAPPFNASRKIRATDRQIKQHMRNPQKSIRECWQRASLSSTIANSPTPEAAQHSTTALSFQSANQVYDNPIAKAQYLHQRQQQQSARIQANREAAIQLQEAALLSRKRQYENHQRKLRLLQIATKRLFKRTQPQQAPTSPSHDDSLSLPQTSNPHPTTEAAFPSRTPKQDVTPLPPERNFQLLSSERPTPPEQRPPTISNSNLRSPNTPAQPPRPGTSRAKKNPQASPLRATQPKTAGYPPPEPPLLPKSQPSNDDPAPSNYDAEPPLTENRMHNVIRRENIPHSRNASKQDKINTVCQHANATVGKAAGDGHCLIHAINKVRSKLSLPELDITTTRRQLVHFYTKDPIGIEGVLNDDRSLEILTHDLLHNWLDEDALLALSHILNCKFTIYHINDNAKYEDGTSFSQIINIEKELLQSYSDPPHTIQLLLMNSTHFSPLLAQDGIVNRPTNPRKSMPLPVRPSLQIPQIHKLNSTVSRKAAQSPRAATANINKKPRTTPDPSTTRPVAARPPSRPLQPCKSGPAHPNTNAPNPETLKPTDKAKPPPRRSNKKPSPPSLPLLMPSNPQVLSDLLREPTTSSLPKTNYLQDQPPQKKQKLISGFFLPTHPAHEIRGPQSTVTSKLKYPQHQPSDPPQKTKAKKQNERGIP